MSTPTLSAPALRPYQLELLNGIRDYFRAGARRVVVQSVTGSGKTVLFAHLIERYVQAGHTALVIVHRRELVDQAAAKLATALGSGELVGRLYTGDRPNQEHHRVVVACIQSLSAKAHEGLLDWLDPSLVIADEAHLSISRSWLKVLERLPAGAFLVGFTATPQRLDGRGLNQQYQGLVHGIQPETLVEGGYLVPFLTYGATDQIDTRHVGKQGGEFITSELEEQIDVIRLAGSAVGEWQRHAQGRPTIAFCLTVAHARAIAQAFNQAGIPADFLCGKDPLKRREEVLERFKCGELLHLSNAALFVEGLDIPSVSCIQLLKPTASLSRYLQMVGRGSRPAPGKQDCILLDHGGNAQRHGLPQEDRLWGLDGKVRKPPKPKPRSKPKPKGNQDGNEKRLIIEDEQATLQLIEATARPKTERELLLALKRQGLSAQWIAFVRGALATRKRRGYKQPWVAYQADEAGAPEALLRLVAAWADMKPGWCWHRLRARQSQQVPI